MLSGEKREEKDIQALVLLITRTGTPEQYTKLFSFHHETTAEMQYPPVEIAAETLEVAGKPDPDFEKTKKLAAKFFCGNLFTMTKKRGQMKRRGRKHPSLQRGPILIFAQTGNLKLATYRAIQNCLLHNRLSIWSSLLQLARSSHLAEYWPKLRAVLRELRISLTIHLSRRSQSVRDSSCNSKF